MPLLRLRVTGNDDRARAIANLLSSLEGVDHIEEIADLMPHMDDPDSSSAGLPDDQGPGVHELEVEVSNAYSANRVRRAVDALASELDVLVEFEVEEER
ncbi:hypothetical protein [Marilutibacter chinensis]|uniref:Uncharacterized protein n=1 Tax=Marilutibacter chinensis TaxID=2912247 RepID=A0ABS9HSL8_9GAMM|nr:hypothetical protein [Lysobacter chinensis]MCF7221194.1 hypothetical protein [Lysobacter chinensis]MCF7223065.1 hypothetical protein [Lysobacter chinensis]